MASCRLLCQSLGQSFGDEDGADTLDCAGVGIPVFLLKCRDPKKSGVFMCR